MGVPRVVNTLYSDLMVLVLVLVLVFIFYGLAISAFGQ